MRKDFGAGEYMDVARIPREIAEHYGGTVTRIESNLAETIRSEVKAGRPLVAYFDDILGIKIVRNGHAAVIDGTAENHGRMLVHMNPGWGGASDGWYDFEKLARERKLRYVFRIVPPLRLSSVNASSEDLSAGAFGEATRENHSDQADCAFNPAPSTESHG